MQMQKIKKPMTQIIGGRFSYGGFSNGDDLRIRGVCGNMGVSGYIY
jgi:hypothetical protein